ncbi:MAG: glycerophosphodiester phosphodiesterase [Vulcanimicrobiota bacterium]
MLIHQGPFVGHRGARGSAPENTFAAFREAHRQGASSIELDVGLSADQQFYVLHDDTLDRTTNGTGRLDQTLSQQLDGLDAGSWYGPDYTGERVPRLADVLDWAKDRIHVTIEVKTSAVGPGVGRRLVEMVEARQMAEQVAIVSFSPEVVAEVEQVKPSFDTGLLLSERPTLGRIKLGVQFGLALGIAGAVVGCSSPLAGLGVAAASTVLGGLVGKGVSALETRRQLSQTPADAILPFWLDADRALARAAARQGKRMVPYTANSPWLVGRLLKGGASAVITDIPGRFTGSSRSRPT